MKRKHNDNAELDSRLASRLLDEALHVFGALLTSAYVDASDFGDELVALLRTTALEILDDVASLSPLAASAPPCPATDETWDRALGDDIPPACHAIEALALYTQRLSVTATLVSHRGGRAASTFTQLAVRAENRLDRLDS